MNFADDIALIAEHIQDTTAMVYWLESRSEKARLITEFDESLLMGNLVMTENITIDNNIIQQIDAKTNMSDMDRIW